MPTNVLNKLRKTDLVTVQCPKTSFQHSFAESRAPNAE